MELSRPYQILLGVVLACALVWFVALRPSGSSSGSNAATHPTPTATSSAPTHGTKLPFFGSAVSRAQQVVRQSQGEAARESGDPSAGQPSKPTQPAQPTPSAQPAAPAATVPTNPHPSAVVRVPGAADPATNGQVFLLLFYKPGSADDDAVRSELAGIGTQGGQIVKRAVPLADLYRYRAITGQLAITQSPTLLVISKNGVQEMTGLVASENITQAIYDARS
jgi:hypothetical protein